jgi:hypothetical protein
MASALLCNHKRTVYEKPYAYREPMCASENCQWCAEPYFVGVGVLLAADTQSQVRVTLRLTVSQSVCLAVKPNLGLLTRDDFLYKVTVLSFLGRTL